MDWLVNRDQAGMTAGIADFPTKKTGWLIGILSIYMVYEIVPHISGWSLCSNTYPLIGGFNPIGKICSSNWESSPKRDEY